MIANFLKRQPKPSAEEDKLAVAKIEKMVLGYLQRMEARKLREELKKLPYICRRSLIKVHDLKQKTRLFR